MGYLYQYTRTIASFVIRTFRSSVLHPFKDLKTPL
jgi:hypothetical protein